MIKFKFALPIAMAFALLATPAAFAEELTPGQNEVLGFVGGYSDGGGGVFGGGFQHAFKPRWMFAAEFGYLTLGGGDGGFSGDISGVPVNSDYSSSAIAVDANVHYLFPLKNEKFTPYVLGGIGVLRASAEYKVTVGGTTTSSGSASDTNFGVNIGGGARWALGTNWGLRPELKIFISDGTNVRYSVGIYYKF